MRLFTSNPKCFNSAFCLWHWLLLVKNQESLWHQLASNKSATIDCATNWFSPSGYLNVLFNQFRTWCEWNSSLCDFGAFCILMLRAKPWDSLNTPTLSLSLSLSLLFSQSSTLSLSLSLNLSFAHHSHSIYLKLLPSLCVHLSLNDIDFWATFILSYLFLFFFLKAFYVHSLPYFLYTL